MSYTPYTSSVVAFQSDPTKLVGTVSVVGNMNSSITAFQGGAWSVSIQGIASVSQIGNWNINTINNPLPAGANFIGNIGGSVLVNVNSGSVQAGLFGYHCGRLNRKLVCSVT